MRLFIFYWLFIITSTTFGQNMMPRKGFVWGVSTGVSSISLSSDQLDTENQMGITAPNIKLGWMVSPKTALLLLLPGTVYTKHWDGRKRDRGFEGFIPSVQYWVKDRWWMLAGLGVAMDAPAFYDIKDPEERKFHFGAAGVVSTGYELWRRGRFALDLQMRAHLGYTNITEDKQNGTAFSIMLGLNWY